MKSKTSFFNRGLSRSLLRRSWPIWLCYFILLLIMVPGDLMQLVEQAARFEYSQTHLANNLNRLMLSGGVNVAILSFFACVLVAMAMFGFMYNNRSTSMSCSLPIKRESVFITAFLTGLVPMLIIDILIALICLAFFTGENMVELKNIGLFLSMALMANVAFYGMAAFCAVLTGHILILPAVYVVLNVAASLAEAGILLAKEALVYGFSGKYYLQALSPIAKLTSDLNVQTQWQRDHMGNMVETGQYLIDGYEWLIIYCIAGLVLSLLAVLIYRRRHMESCGDVVAIPVLKPIFRYCMCFGVALMFAYCIHAAVFDSFLRGTGEALCYGALMLLGAFIGYFAAEMLMQKTLRVFRGKWKGFIASSLILLSFVGINEADIMGYERRMPRLNDIESVELGYHEGCTYKKQENIAALMDFHQLLIDEKAVNENAHNSQSVRIKYCLTNGKSFDRIYPISFDLEQQRADNSGIMALGRVINLQEAIDRRVATEVPVSANNILEARFEGRRLNAEGEAEYFEFVLSDQQAYEFYTRCVLPDAAEGRLCRLFPVNTEEYFDMVSSVSFHFVYYDDQLFTSENWNHCYKSFTMYMDAERCCEWIGENTDIELISMGELDPEAREKTLGELRAINPVPTMEYSR